MSSLFIPKLQGDGLDLRRYVPGKGVRELWWHQAHQIADIAAQCVRCLQQPFANAAVTGRGSPDPFQIVGLQLLAVLRCEDPKVSFVGVDDGLRQAGAVKVSSDLGEMRVGGFGWQTVLHPARFAVAWAVPLRFQLNAADIVWLAKEGQVTARYLCLDFPLTLYCVDASQRLSEAV